MKESYWGYWLIVLGVLIIFVLLLVQHFTSNNTQDYYLVKEISESAMQDSIDMTYYKKYNELKIDKEKFEEVFIRRFAEDASISNTYTLEFFDVYETPPKISVKISSKASSYNITSDSDDLDMVNKIDAILEANSEVSTYKETTEYPLDANGYIEQFFVEETNTDGLSTCTERYEKKEQTYNVIYCGKRIPAYGDKEDYCVGINVENPSEYIYGKRSEWLKGVCAN